MSAATPPFNKNYRRPYVATNKAPTGRYNHMAFNERCGTGITYATKAHPPGAPNAALGHLRRGLMARERRRTCCAPWI